MWLWALKSFLRTALPSSKCQSHSILFWMECWGFIGSCVIPTVHLNENRWNQIFSSLTCFMRLHICSDSVVFSSMNRSFNQCLVGWRTGVFAALTRGHYTGLYTSRLHYISTCHYRLYYTTHNTPFPHTRALGGSVAANKWYNSNDVSRRQAIHYFHAPTIQANPQY